MADYSLPDLGQLPPPRNSRLQESADQPLPPTSPTLMHYISHHDWHHIERSNADLPIPSPS